MLYLNGSDAHSPLTEHIEHAVAVVIKVVCNSGVRMFSAGNTAMAGYHF